MFEAYRVGVTVALTNKVSQGLMLIGRDLAKTDAQALKLKTTLNQIKLLGIGGAILGTAGYTGLHALGKTLDAAKEYQQAFAQFKSLNLGDAVNAQADKFARGASVIGASATDLMATTRDLTTVLGNVDMAKQLAPGFAQLKFANQAVYGGMGVDFNETQLRNLEKIIEMKGGFKTPQEFLNQASMMQQVIAGTGGMVKPSDYLNFIKTAGVSGRLLTDKSFYYGMEPLIQEMGGSRVGTGLMSAYNNLAQGRSSVRAATELMRLGLLDPNMVEYTKIGTIKQVKPGALKDTAGYGSNPYQWMQDVLLPSMRAKGITSEQGVLQEMGVIFGNRTASSLFSLMFMQQEKIAKNMALSQNAMTSGQMVKLARSSPEGAEMALGKAWENLKIATGEALIPIVIPGIKQAGRRHAGRSGIGSTVIRCIFDTLIVKGFAGLSTALLFGGVILGAHRRVQRLEACHGVPAGLEAVEDVDRSDRRSAALIAGTRRHHDARRQAAAPGLRSSTASSSSGTITRRSPTVSTSVAPGIGDGLLRDFQSARRGAGDWLSAQERSSCPRPASGSSLTTVTVNTVNLDGRRESPCRRPSQGLQCTAASPPNSIRLLSTAA